MSDDTQKTSSPDKAEIDDAVKLVRQHVIYLEEQLRLMGQELGDLRGLGVNETTNASFVQSYRDLLKMYKGVKEENALLRLLINIKDQRRKNR